MMIFDISYSIPEEMCVLAVAPDLPSAVINFMAWAEPRWEKVRITKVEERDVLFASGKGEVVLTSTPKIGP